jgi:hypothetical protein
MSEMELSGDTRPTIANAGMQIRVTHSLEVNSLQRVLILDLEGKGHLRAMACFNSLRIVHGRQIIMAD